MNSVYSKDTSSIPLETIGECRQENVFHIDEDDFYSEDVFDIDDRVQTAKERWEEEMVLKRVGLACGGCSTGTCGFIATVIGVNFWMENAVAGPVITGVGLFLCASSLTCFFSSCYYAQKKYESDCDKEQVVDLEEI